MSRVMKTMDGNNAAAHVSYAFTEVASIFPITPSSVMAELTDAWSASGMKNIFGQQVKVVEMQSEAGAAGAVHGSLAAGALTTTYTASQGLLLMIPNMYKISGELLPGVIHCSARALAGHALSIFGDHSDVMACRQTGFAMLASTNPQEVMDLGAVAHLAAIKGRVPFLHFFDGFRTSHEIQKIETWDYETLKGMLDMDAVESFRKNALNPEHPVLRGSAQNPDIFFQAKESSNNFYNNLPAVVEEYMGKVNEAAGTDYKLFNYYGAPDAEYVIVAMGSVCDAIEETIDYMSKKGAKVGLVKVRLFRPFVSDKFIAAIPATCKKVAVLDRCKEPGALGEPLYLDIVTAIYKAGKAIEVVGGRYGLGSKDTVPANIISTYENLKAEKPINGFTIGIIDDVTHLSLPTIENPDTTPAGTHSCKFWGLGSDGTVGANKNSIKIIGDHTDMYAQAYFAYDSKKSGGVTISHLRFGSKPIKSTYLISQADFVACHNPSYITKYRIVQDLKKGGSFLLNCAWTGIELEEHLPNSMKRYIAENGIKFYTIDGIGIAREIGLGNRINMVLQSAFFKISSILPIEDAVKYMKDAVVKSYGKRGEKVIAMNHEAIDRGVGSIVEVKVPAEWKKLPDEIAAKAPTSDRPELAKFIKEIMVPVNAQAGDELPVSAFVGAEDGHLPAGSAAFEKRGVAVDVPEWIPENCIQCNRCSYVCPHAVIRPFALTDAELAAAPKGYKSVKMTGKGAENYKFAINVSVLDCTGCSSCVNVCPSKEKAIIMKPFDTQLAEQDSFNYAFEKLTVKADLPFAVDTLKGSQFRQPLLEFSGACAGCGETPYAKLITQLYGDRMYIANATGCSSIWGGSAPATPYTVNKDGKGPAWANSLFEDNAEYGLGMSLAVNQRRAKLNDTVKKVLEVSYLDEKIAAACKEWLDAFDDGEASKAASSKLEALILAHKSVPTCGCEACTLCREILTMKDVMVKKSIWIFGGDGWAYDIGYGGLDHVAASGEDVNIFVFDTEVYSNTGGQASKASQTGQVAQFAAAGKNTGKKDLAGMLMSYGYVYVAQIGLGADYNQAIKAISEAESYKGPSIVIAYAPCINHGIRGGLSNPQAVIKAAVDAGYWHLFRFDPRKESPFVLDSKAPSSSYLDFIKSEVRYSSLERSFPDRAGVLFGRAVEIADKKYNKLTKMSRLYDKD